MLANMSSSFYNSDTGNIVVEMPNTTINGYSNSVGQYQTANTLSVPLPGNLVSLNVQCPTQMQVIGYQNSIIDNNYSIVPGEFTSYSTSWYASTRNSGIEIQEANTAHKENQVMGQSTNAVLLDIMNLLVEVVTYLGTHVHTGVMTGGSNTGTVFGSPTIPDDSEVISDQTYIGDNKNLAITGVYTPK